MGRKSKFKKQRRVETNPKGATAIKKTVPKKTIPPLVHDSGFWRRNYIAALILVIIPFILYAATFNYGYVLDDVIVLAENDFVKEGISGISDIFSNDVFTGYLGEKKDLVAGGRYRPLSLVVFAIEYEIFGDKPGWNHFLNVVWYAFLGLLIFRILGMLFPQGSGKWYFSIPFVAVLLFMTHPVHCEAVANIKGRDEIMTFALSMVTMYLSLRYLSSQKIYYLVFSSIAFLLALLAKENAITFFAVIPLTIYTFTKADWKDNLKVLIPLVVATVVYLVIRYQVIGYFLDSGKEVTGLMNNPFRDMNGGEKYATIFYTLWEYIRLMFVPHPLTHDYYPYHIPITNWSQLRAILPLTLYIVLIGYALVSLRKRRHVPAYSIWFFVITLSITSNMVFSVGTFMNERFAFIPSLGFTILLAYWLIDMIPKRLEQFKSISIICMAIAGLTIFGYSYKTMARVPAWENSFTLNTASIKVSKNSARLNSFMGYDYYTKANATKDRELKKQYYDQATPYINKALEIHPTYPDALRAKAGIVAGYYGIDGNLESLLNGFYNILAVRHVPYIDEYMEYLNRRGYNATIIDFYHNTGYILFAQSKGEYTMALKYLGYGYNMDPRNTQILQDLTIVNYMVGKYANARAYGQAALQVNPNLPEMTRYLGLINERVNAIN